MASKKKLPDIVYVYYDYDGEDAYLIACDKMSDAAEKDRKVLVGIYSLDSLVNVSLEVKAEQAK